MEATQKKVLDRQMTKKEHKTYRSYPFLQHNYQIQIFEPQDEFDYSKENLQNKHPREFGNFCSLSPM